MLPSTAPENEDPHAERGAHRPLSTRRKGPGRRLRSISIAALALTLVVGAAVVARATETAQRLPSSSTVQGAAAQAVGSQGDTGTGNTTAGTSPHGDLTFGTWQGQPIVVPPLLAPPAGSHLTSVIVGRGVLAFYCVNGTFVETEPLINLFSQTGKTIGLHYLGPNSIVPLSWASSIDGSRADMAVAKAMPQANTAPRALLRAVATAGNRGTLFGGTTAIVRLPVTGGLPPTAQCAVPTQRVLAPFVTLYLVFKGGTFPHTAS
jgi:hypothetical protein